MISTLYKSTLYQSSTVTQQIFSQQANMNKNVLFIFVLLDFQLLSLDHIASSMVIVCFNLFLPLRIFHMGETPIVTQDLSVKFKLLVDEVPVNTISFTLFLWSM